MPDAFTINFRWVANAQKPTEGAVRQQIETASDGFARIMVNQIALASADGAYKRAQRELRTSVERIIRVEVNRMAKQIAGKLAVADGYTGPYGTLTLRSDDFERGWREGADAGGSNSYFNQLSKTAKAAGFRQTFQMRETGIKWSKRSSKYMRWKARKGLAGNWWKKTGALKSWLSNSAKGDFYEKAFGPIRVIFTKLPNASAEGSALTKTGLVGKISKTVSVGRLEVLVFNRITPAMMPGLASMNPASNPQPGLGVAKLLGQRYSRNRQVVKLLRRSAVYDEWKSVDRRVPASEIHQKLWGKKFRMKKFREKTTKGGSYRPAIDPFVSFYLTRAIPNAVWRRTEQFVERKVITNVVRSVS